MSVSRRQFVKAAAATTAVALPALVVGFSLPARRANAADARFNAWLRIAADDTVTIALSQAEMGQDIYTIMPRLIAEELEADWSRIRVELAVNDPAFANPMFGAQATAGSSSVVAFDAKLRMVGAQAREMLRQAAAQNWGVSVDDCRAESGAIVHAKSGRRLSYGALAEAASRLTPPAAVKLKDAKDWTLLGRSTPRLDAPAKSTGAAVYGVDVQLPNMLTGTVRACPAFGGALKALDDKPALAIPGVHSVVKLDNAFIVLADGYWPARQGAEALKPVWDFGPLGSLSSEQMSQQLIANLAQPGLPAVTKGDAAAAIAASPRKLEAVYQVPYLAHVTMEPMSGTVSVHADGVEAWLPTQAPGWHQMALAQICGVKPEQVRINSTFLGGGFGRRAEIDFAMYPALASKASGRPVKVIWSREEDIQHDVYRPATVGRLRAALDPSGRPTALELKLVAQSISARLSGAAPPSGAPASGPPPPDPFAITGLSDLEYGLDHWNASYVEQKTGAPVGTWRSVPNTFNGYFIECFIDEIAHQGGHDPVELRRTLLAASPRQLAVLEKAVAASGWGKPPPGRFQGIAVVKESGTIVCEVAEVSVDAGKTLRVHKVTAVIDCGRALNPRGVEAQVQGAIMDGLSAALFGEITLEGGRVAQSNFDSYPLLRMAQAPELEVHIIDSGVALGGVGECAVGPAAPALANAIFAANGERLRRLPVVKAGYSLGA